MTRAVNVNLTEAAVRELATDQQAQISSIEALPGGGTRVVFSRTGDADQMRNVFSGQLIQGEISRPKWASHGR